ncbi:MAG: peptidyl-prolyl cis-trans isomerase, EpsD family [Azoarcus sp. PHD]|nr:MAG: peptidyl-prolyl cis-trans isomerase, EpsD family [Azoarcus sp. PHD]
MFQPVRVAPLLAVIVIGLLSGCGAEKSTSKPASQVAAKVNKEELSVHQLNELLMRSGNVPADQVKQASAAALERLIDQELLVQQAKERKLDRTPKVMQAIESARREILARAYADQVAGFGVRPSASEVSAFYEANPGLFAKRRIYDLRELSIRIPAERYAELRDAVRGASTPEEVSRWLTEKSIPFTAGDGTKPAEQLPMEVLNGLVQLETGQAAVSRTPYGALILFLAGYRDEPIDRAKAQPFIEQYLLNQAKVELAKAELKRLREIARIEYVGEFATAAAAADDGAKVAAPEALPETARSIAGSGSALEKGAAGLN